MTRLTVTAPAKINLTLDVLDRRPDGYHDIRSIMQTIDLCDTLTVTPRPGEPGIALEVSGPESAGVPTDETNLVWRAADRMLRIVEERGLVDRSRTGVHINLEKHIPSQAGLGGGSSDATATLKTISQLLGVDITMAEMTHIAASLGADVPFFLIGGTALVTGIGENVLPLPTAAQWPLVVVKPPTSVSTAAAYAALDSVSGRNPSDATLEWLDYPALSPFGNDFEQAIVPAHPVIASVMDFLRRSDAGYPPVLCGSGSAVFCRVANEEIGAALAAEASSRGLGKSWLARTTL